MGGEGAVTKGLEYQPICRSDANDQEEFNAKTFFALNDLDGNGLLDLEEVKIVNSEKRMRSVSQVRRLLLSEMEKAYDNGVEGDDRRERRWGAWA